MKNVDSIAAGAPSLAESSDEAILHLIAQEDEDALREFQRRYGQYIRWLAQSVVHNEAVADELAQEILLQVWNQAKNYTRSRGKAVNWLATIARRRAIDRLRQRRAYTRALDRLQLNIARETTQVPRDTGIEREVVPHDLREFLDHLMGELPHAQKSVIHMAFIEQCSQREIAKKTNTPVGTVKTRYELGLRKLQRRARCMRGSI